MICYSHQKPISFLCKSSQCAYLPLCSDCRSSHISNNSANHDFQLLTLNEGLVQAQGNLDKQFKAINELMSPLQIRKEIVRQIEEQKQ